MRRYVYETVIVASAWTLLSGHLTAEFAEGSHRTQRNLQLPQKSQSKTSWRHSSRA